MERRVKTRGRMLRRWREQQSIFSERTRARNRARIVRRYARIPEFRDEMRKRMLARLAIYAKLNVRIDRIGFAVVDGELLDTLQDDLNAAASHVDHIGVQAAAVHSTTEFATWEPLD
jgi:Holliday junction resolvasome RuvABC ATP-dependent DNA helicase subunit